MLLDLASLTALSAVAFVVSDPTGFIRTCAAAVLLALAWWFLVAPYTRLWNCRFRGTIAHHVLRATASAAVPVFVVLYASLNYARPAVERMVDVWRLTALTDHAWSTTAFQLAREAVLQGTPEEGSDGVAGLADGEPIIPRAGARADTIVASRYAAAALEHFRSRHPLLVSFLGLAETIPEERIRADIAAFFSARAGDRGRVLYPLDRSVALAVREIGEALVARASILIRRSRLLLTIAFCVLQVGTLSAIGIGAYRQIRVH